MSTATGTTGVAILVRFCGTVWALCLVLAACAAYPPRDGVELEGRGGLDAVFRQFAITPLDPEGPLLPQALDRARRSVPDRKLDGVTYSLTEGNRLTRDWIVQSPNVWGQSAGSIDHVALDCAGCDPDLRLPPCRSTADCRHGICAVLRAAATALNESPKKYCLGHSDALIDRFYDLIVTAERAVDIAMLQPPADLRFRAGLRNALTRLARSGNAITVRILIGTYPPKPLALQEFAAELLRDAAGMTGSRLQVFVGSIRSCNGEAGCGAFSWNHAKFIAVDGRAAIVGGHNMWTEDYLLDKPVHDLSMRLEGPAAYDVHRFADALWKFVCGRPEQDSLNLALTLAPGGGKLDRGCLSNVDLRPAGAYKDGVAVLSIGRLAKGITDGFADQSMLVQSLMLDAARKTIRIVQQDIAFSLAGGVDRQWPDALIDNLADLIARRGGDAYLVLSGLGADGRVSDYSNHVAPDAVVRRVRDNIRDRIGIAEPGLSSLVCQRLHVAPLRFGPEDSWPGGHPIGVHTKLWMIDDRAFHIGSENLYPVELQEFGYIVEDAAATASLKREYWDKAWQWSRRAAISGSDAPRCILLESARG